MKGVLIKMLLLIGIGALFATVLLFTKQNTAKNQMEVYELMNGGMIDYFLIDSASFEELKNEAKSCKLEEKFKNKYDVVVYSLDNQIFVHMGGEFLVFKNLDEVERVLHDHQILVSSGGVELLFNRNPFGSKLPDHAKEQADKLLIKFELEREDLNRELLVRLDEKLDKYSDREFMMENFLGLICLVGEVMINESGAKWEMQLCSDRVTWNPLLGNGNEKVNFLPDLYEMIFLEKNNTFILTTVYDVYIGPLKN